MSRILLFAGGASLLALLLLVLRKVWPGAGDESMEEVELDTLELSDVVAWFKRRAELLSKQSVIAVLLKMDSDAGRADGRQAFVQSFLDRDTDNVIHARKIFAARLSPELESKFGDKAMLVFTSAEG